MNIKLDTSYTENGGIIDCKDHDDLIYEIDKKYKEAEDHKAKEIKVYVVYY